MIVSTNSLLKLRTSVNFATMKSLENKTGLVPDLFFCLVFMPVLVVLGPAHHWLTQWPLFFATVCVVMYGCYFAMVRADVPRLLLGRRYRRLAATVVILIGANWLLTLYPLPDIDFVTPAMSEYQTRVRNFGISVTIWLMFSLVMGYSLTVSFVKALYGELLLKKKVEAERDRAELAVFKAQISPHFLFNTLNSLYSLVIGTSEKAEDAFIKFTEILKYTYVTIEKESVPLRDEIAYIQNYIDLQAIRLNEHTRVNRLYEIDNEELPVPPMLMLTFVENAFKYGSSTSKDCVIDISLRLRGGTLEFETRNSIMKHADEFRQTMPTGLDNCRARLSTLYPGRHTLVACGDDEGVWRVSLTIQLTQP